MGLATIDSYGQKKHAEIPKIPKFGVNQKSGFVRISIHLFVIFSRF